MLEEGQKQPGELWLVQVLGQVELPDDGEEIKQQFVSN